MNILELIDQLEKIEDKTKPVLVRGVSDYDEANEISESVKFLYIDC